MYPSKMIGYNRQLTSHFDTSTPSTLQLDGYVQMLNPFAHSHLTRNWELPSNAAENHEKALFKSVTKTSLSVLQASLYVYSQISLPVVLYFCDGWSLLVQLLQISFQLLMWHSPSIMVHPCYYCFVTKVLLFYFHFLLIKKFKATHWP